MKLKVQNEWFVFKNDSFFSKNYTIVFRKKETRKDFYHKVNTYKLELRKDFYEKVNI